MLRKIEGHSGPPVSGADKELAEMTGGKITLRHQPISKLCDFLTDSLLAVTVDETGMNGRYDFDIPYQPGDPGVALRALKDIGLEAFKTRRNVSILVVMPEVATLDEKR